MVDIVPRRFETHGGFVIPTDVLAWAVSTANRIEPEWGLGEEDVSLIHNLCGSRGPVGAHVDTDYVGSVLIYGLIVEGYGHELFSEGTPKDDMPLSLHPGVVYVLDPAVEHGTYAGPDDRLLFLVDSMDDDDPAPPEVLFARLINEARRAIVAEERALQQVAVRL